MRISSSRDLSKIEKTIIVKTPRNFSNGIAEFVKVANELSEGVKIKAVAGGIVGPLDLKRTKVVNAPNLKSWNNCLLKKTLEKRLKTKVYIENDTAMVALGETHYGAGKAFKKNGIVAYVTVSTGVGGARIVDGKIDKSIYGFEIGYQTIDADGSIFPKYKSPGYLEDYVSGKSVLLHTGKNPASINNQKFWNDMAKLLSYGLNNTILHWSPSIVILGGSMMNKVGIPLVQVNKHLDRILKIFPQKPKIVHSRLGDLGGIYGSMIYLVQELGKR